MLTHAGGQSDYKRVLCEDFYQSALEAVFLKQCFPERKLIKVRVIMAWEQSSSFETQSSPVGNIHV
jgi:hypothetical protein